MISFGLSANLLREMERQRENYSDDEVFSDLSELTESVLGFWQHYSGGWAPESVSDILEGVEFDRLILLTKCLPKWALGETEGELVLAWANLGALVEGALKLLLTVHLNDYQKGKGWKKRRQGEIVNPDLLKFEELKVTCEKNDVWLEDRNWSAWIQFIQERRNTIHVFRKREIGTFAEWMESIRWYLIFLYEVDGRLPRP